MHYFSLVSKTQRLFITLESSKEETEVHLKIEGRVLSQTLAHCYLLVH